MKKTKLMEYETLIKKALFVWYNEHCKFPSSEAKDMVHNLFIDLLSENKRQTFEVKPCHDSKFKGIACLEDDERYGFFKSDADIRPGHATWIKKEAAEKLSELLIERFGWKNEGKRNTNSV